MDDRSFDELTRRLGAGASRRRVLGGLLGLSAAAVVTARSEDALADTRWSVTMCIPAGDGSYITRLVPRSAVGWYQRTYGAFRATNGACPACQPGGCVEPSPATCAGFACPSGCGCFEAVTGPVCTSGGGTACTQCRSNADCTADAPVCGSNPAGGNSGCNSYNACWLLATCG